jgi:putative PIN family toxin of toxin-antitoxin system
MDTNVFIGALIGQAGHNRKLVRACLWGTITPLMGHALLLEHLDVMGRESLFTRSPLSAAERSDLFNAFLSVCGWVRVYYSWRPNLTDESDNHIVELAVAGSADAIVTNNTSDFRGGELLFRHIPVFTPEQFLKEIA